jgi:hypothetical protein
VKIRVPAAIMVALSLTLAACGGGDDPNDAIKKAAEKAVAESVKDATKDSSKDSSSKDSDGSSTKPTTKVDDTSSGSSSSGGSGSSGIPNMTNLGDCLTISMSSAGLGLASLGGLLGGQQPSKDDLAELQKSIDELRNELPKEVQGDFKIVADAYSLAAKEGFMSKKAQDALESKDFDRANTNIQNWLDKNCGTGE